MGDDDDFSSHFSADLDQRFNSDGLQGEYRHQRVDSGSSRQWSFDEFSSRYQLSAPGTPKQKAPFSPMHSASEALLNPISQLQTTTPLKKYSGGDTSLAALMQAGEAFPDLVSIVHLIAWREEAKHPALQLGLLVRMIDLEKRPRPEHLQENLAVTNYIKTQGLRLARRLATSLEDKKTGGDAQFLLGSSYGCGGLGLAENEEQAFHWYLQASKLAHPEATYRAGVCYELGLGTRKDLQRALIFFRRAAQNSHVLSMYKLGIILIRGLYHQPKLLRDGVGWLQRAVMTSENQVPEPLHALAMAQLTPDVNERCHTDPGYAIQLLHDAARLDYVPSLLQLAACYERGQAVEADDALSIYWYTRAASLRSSEGALGLAAWYLTGARGVLEASTDLAFQWAHKAVHFARLVYVEKGVGRWELAKACFFVGFLIEQGVAPVPTPHEDSDSHHTATYWFRLAADLGHMTASQRITTTAADENDLAPVPSPELEPDRKEKNDKKKDKKKKKKKEKEDASKPEV